MFTSAICVNACGKFPSMRCARGSYSSANRPTSLLNETSRYHLCIEALQQATRVRGLTAPLIAECNEMLEKHTTYIRENFEDMPEVRDWVWTD